MKIQMKLKWCVSAVLLTAIVALAACGSHSTQPTDAASIRNAIVGKVWHLEKLFLRDVSSDTDLTLEFKNDNTVSGFGGCNDFNGIYTLQDDNLKFGPMTSTRKSCGAGIGEQEYSYLTFLSTITNVKLEEGELHLLNDKYAGAIIFTTGDQGFW